MLIIALVLILYNQLYGYLIKSLIVLVKFEEIVSSSISNFKFIKIWYQLITNSFKFAYIELIFC
jgi:hypothetical protein